MHDDTDLYDAINIALSGRRWRKTAVGMRIVYKIRNVSLYAVWPYNNNIIAAKQYASAFVKQNSGARVAFPVDL